MAWGLIKHWLGLHSVVLS